MLRLIKANRYILTDVNTYSNIRAGQSIRWFVLEIGTWNEFIIGRNRGQGQKLKFNNSQVKFMGLCFSEIYWKQDYNLGSHGYSPNIISLHNVTFKLHCLNSL